ncbi:MAG: hypothetical protein ABIC68_04085 [Candidatus Omnitrophota bacterium]
MVYKFILRSKGVVIFAISLIAFGAFSAFLLILSISLISLKDIVPEFNAMVPMGTLSMTLFWTSSLLNLFIFLSWVVCGIGVLHLKDWARKFLRIVMAIHLVNMIVNIYLNIFLAQEVMSKIPVGFLFGGIGIAFSYYLSVIYFFSHPNVVKQFKFKSREY